MFIDSELRTSFILRWLATRRAFSAGQRFRAPSEIQQGPWWVWWV